MQIKSCGKISNLFIINQIYSYTINICVSDYFTKQNISILHSEIFKFNNNCIFVVETIEKIIYKKLLKIFWIKSEK